jgi:DNA-directed RNA polymerase specialized sigma24 family protein
MSRAGDYWVMKDANRGPELERVLLAHGPALGRLAASYESRPALREELLQDIAFALWRALPSFRHEAS